jgi:lipopolysaccharide/colanic/teichoic acid biosynthesis glycosyltransferase
MTEQVYLTIKRIIDLTGALVVGIIFLPFLLVIAVLIKLYDGGPVFADIPPRVGKDGMKFHLYKFRSMIENAHNILREKPEYADLYEKYKRNSYKLAIEEDPRITPIGRFIRKHSLDEFPQLLNVIRGEMSLVGPRAYYPDELEAQPKKFPHVKDLINEVLSVKPGVTGLWQVSGRNEIDFDERIKLDACYASKKSLLFDLWILLKTPWVVITGRGAE